MRPLRFPTALSALCGTIALTAALALAPAAVRAQGVISVLQPAYGFVAPGSEFDVDFVVPYAGSLFNGFRAVFHYDPAALTFLQAVPIAVQQGCLMTGACSPACGNTFHITHAVGDSITVDLSMLCDTIFIAGPGQLYRLHFRAANTDLITYVTVGDVVFANSGIYVTPVTTANSRIVIGVPAGVEGGANPPGALRLGAEPNPAHGAVAFSIAASRDGVQALDVLDLSGRLVRHLSAGWQPRGTRRLTWDGTGAGGERLAAGVYMVRLRAGADEAIARVTLIR